MMFSGKLIFSYAGLENLMLMTLKDAEKPARSWTGKTRPPNET